MTLIPDDTPQGDLTIERVTGDGRAFAFAAFAKHRDRLSNIAAPWVAIGARWRGTPIALALGEVRNDRAMLHSVMVAPAFRRTGVGRTLLHRTAIEARAIGATVIEARYSGMLRTRLPLEALFASAGWSQPAIADIQLVGLVGTMTSAVGDWGPVRRAMQRQSDYAIEPYAVRDAADHAAIDAILATSPELLVEDPRKRATLDPRISVMVRHRGVPIGWIAAEPLTESIGYGTVVPGAVSVYYSGARFADGHNKMLMVLAYHHAFARQAERHGAMSRAIYRTHPAAAAMYAFTRTRFAPSALHVEEQYGVRLSLIDDGG